MRVTFTYIVSDNLPGYPSNNPFYSYMKGMLGKKVSYNTYCSSLKISSSR